jgi:cytoskeletal protein CcmA (bactofilin family)
MKRNPDARDGGLSIIAPGMRVEGQIITTGVVKVEGTVVGAIQADQQVLVSSGGIVEGDIRTREAVIGGTVHGSIHAEERVEVQGDAVVQGDITTFRLFIHEGGEVNGLLKMGRLSGLLDDSGSKASVAGN